MRHIEVQILGLADGRVVALGERECSVQRRNQKLVEESPSPASMLTPARRAALLAAAVRAGEAVGYRNAGTVECLLDPSTGDFYFLEMNTRLQVEHPVTEAVFGVDLVEEQLRVASGLPPTFDPDALVSRGHAIELRVNAEDPKRFLPGPGAITTWVEPTGDGVRVDSGYAAGTTVTPNYDSLMAKLIVHGADRAEALERARAAVAAFEIVGPKHNLPFFAELLDNDGVPSPATTTPPSLPGCGRRPRCQGTRTPQPSRSARSGRATACRTRSPCRPRRRSACSMPLGDTGCRPDRGGQLRASEGHPADGRRRRGMGAASECAGVRYSALVPNSRGAQRALDAGFRELEVVVSASDTHNRRQRQPGTDESLDDIAGIIESTHAAGAVVRGHHLDELRLPVRGRRGARAGGVHCRPCGGGRRRPDRVR